MDDNQEFPAVPDTVKMERIELALRASYEGIWDWQVGQREIFYSRRCLEFFECGDRRAPNIFLPPHDSIHPDEEPDFNRAMRQAVGDDGPEILAVNTQVKTGSGDYRWLRIRGIVVRDRKGKAIRITGSMIDINRRKAAEGQVEEERFQLRQLTDHIPVQVYFKDKDSNFVMANQRMADWLSLPNSDSLIGKHDRDFFDEDHWKPAAEDEKKILESGEPITGQLEHETRHDGEETWVVTSKFPWRDRNGDIKGTFGVSSDVTNLVLAQREATNLAAQLQEKNQAYEEEVHLAREIQQALTTSEFPSVRYGNHELNFGTRYVPISGLAGDFFEVIKISDTQVGVMICDVMGHGVRSALIVAMLRGLLEKQRAQAKNPSAFLRGLNDGLTAILDRAGTTMFATAFYCFIDLPTGKLTYACAGHPGPIAVGKSGIYQLATERGAKGPGLGLIKDAKYPSKSMDLDDIERIVMYTDGVVEAENQEGEPFFESRLMDIVEKNSDTSLESLLDGIINAVLDFSKNQHFDDDVCLMAFDVVTTKKN